ncbi:tRNA preQ1(34) S-adenosylmethionine ribosyltransferase-isomerase QueA [Helicobacter sp. 13S00401-1]|uniref:tRNA preQ1(34) S-adenosylmethionine ribosyltransferase-isomerase QueA n=1 Tax=Helicobacter sp. 13S00401-1 TaxID=1905758 RepID=UPI000BA5A732|nr:tRNA preQ1(34) S-adenosylmethionine ribosyltransferase-isomerase QueA [Helicobacter sp. 13S00401-1]PAF51423.1 tRNA preQ1(34) S-adenosylmethionine ribosyltransferase-isomerase QueA [Helicobacter sp. 13S00401-1]
MKHKHGASPLELSSYDFSLDPSFIALSPPLQKEDSKLLVYERTKDKVTHTTFKSLFTYLPKDHLIVMNDTKVIKARFYGFKNEKRYEIFFHKESGHKNGESIFLVQIKGKVKEGDLIAIQKDLYVKVLRLLDSGFREVSFVKNAKSLKLSEVLKLLDDIGLIPLPPYIKREANAKDELDYQSAFAKNLGSVAAPTASLHFSDTMLSYLKSHYEYLFLTLHVGAGTFQPVQVENILDHKIHTESFFIDEKSLTKLKESKKILCIGTTALRTVEYLDEKNYELSSGECDIFLHPLNPPKKATSLLTNFHLPKSSLIMLVASMIGLEKTLELYELAKTKDYKFYSYGDGMLIL